jgi:Mn2+/Fe2+ NRAMP family transporter
MLLLYGRYGQIVAVLRYLTLGFAIFIVAAVLARPDWSRVAEASLIPSISLRSGSAAGAIALLGTTLTSYVYFWETVQRGTEQAPVSDRGRVLWRARAGSVAGAVLTAVILWSMLVASAATLGRRHLPVSSAVAASAALRPAAGPLAADLFAAGLVISALVALPVLIACTAYVVGAQFDWQRGLSQPVARAPRFYAVLAGSITLAIVITLAGVPVVGTLVAASILGGLSAPAGLVILLLLGRDARVMRGRPISLRLAVAGWAVTAIVTASGLLFLAVLARHLAEGG